MGSTVPRTKCSAVVCRSKATIAVTEYGRCGSGSKNVRYTTVVCPSAACKYGDHCPSPASLPKGVNVDGCQDGKLLTSTAATIWFVLGAAVAMAPGVGRSVGFIITEPGLESSQGAACFPKPNSFSTFLPRPF